MRLSLIVPVAVLAWASASCASGDDDGLRTTLSDDAVVEYRFLDASVPPEHHRSYTLRISADEVHVVVDSYGDVRHDVVRSLPTATWVQVRDGVFALLDEGAVGGDDDDDDSCAGGTGRELVVVDGGTTLVEVDASACGGRGADRVEALDALVRPVIAGIADWDVLVAQGP